MAKCVFILDDEADMVRIATDLLEPEGFLIQSDAYPSSALKKIRANPPDILLLDVKLPETDGFSICKELKSDPKTKHIPVIMVSVKSDETDVVVGLEMGADDYIIKPFRKRELIARVKTILRRMEMDPRDQKFQLGPLVVDYGRYGATLNGKNLQLTPKEFELLGFLIRREGRVLTRATISENVWGIEFTGSTRTIDVHIDQLRRKLGRSSNYIKSLKGVGYRFELED